MGDAMNTKPYTLMEVLDLPHHAGEFVGDVSGAIVSHDRLVATIKTLEKTERFRAESCRAWADRAETAEASAKSANEQLARTEIAYARAIAELERLGFRRCDTPACDCGGWHQHRPTVVEESLAAQVEALKKERDHWRDEHGKRRGECLAAQMVERAAQDRAEANLIDHGLREAALLAERDAARERLAHDTEQWLKCIKERDAARRQLESCEAAFARWKAETQKDVAAIETLLAERDAARKEAAELRSALEALVEAIEAEAESSSPVDDDASVQTFVDARKALDKSKPEPRRELPDSPAEGVAKDGPKVAPEVKP